MNREWNIACKNPEERDYDAIRYLRLGEFADMVGYSRDNAKRLAKELNSVRFEWHGKEQTAFIYMTKAPDRPEEWIIAVTREYTMPGRISSFYGFRTVVGDNSVLQKVITRDSMI